MCASGNTHVTSLILYTEDPSDRLAGLWSAIAEGPNRPGQLIVATSASASAANLPGDPDSVVAIPGATYGTVMNAAIALTRGDSVVVLTDDVVPRDGWNKALVKEGGKTGCGIAGGRVVADGRIVNAGFDLDSATDIGLRVRLSGTLQNGFEALQGTNVFAPSTGPFLISRAALDSCTGFDDELNQPFALIDLSIRTRAAGMKVTYCPGAIAESVGSSVHHLECAELPAHQIGRLLDSADAFYSKWVDAGADAGSERKRLAEIAAAWLEQDGSTVARRA